MYLFETKLISTVFMNIRVYRYIRFIYIYTYIDYIYYMYTFYTVIKLYYLRKKLPQNR